MTSLNRGLELAMLLTLPATVALLVIPWPIVVVLFERGAFVARPATPPPRPWPPSPLGLPAYVLVKVLQPAFFAREDTMTPLKFWSPCRSAPTSCWPGVVLPVIGFVGLAWRRRLPLGSTRIARDWPAPPRAFCRSTSGPRSAVCRASCWPAC